jgi:hypothetical protein
MTDSIDQWLDWGDHTVTIDPMGNKKWILESDTEGHSQSIARKRRFDAADVRDLMGWQNRHPLQSPSYYEPTISGRQLYSDPIGKGCKQWRGQKRDSWRFGKLPVITQLIRDGALHDKTPGQIEHEMREWERTRDVWSVYPVQTPFADPHAQWNLPFANPLNVVA